VQVLTIAKRYFDAGFTPVPVLPKTKTPACEWSQWQYRRPSWKELEQVWLEAIHRYGDDVGVATILGRAHGIVALDVDDPEQFRQARQAVGLTEEELKTWAQKSARGGALFFKHPEHTTIRRFYNEYWGAELRGDGHIQLLPPSLHPTGIRYEWLKGRSPHECELADLPDILLEAFVRCDEAEPFQDAVETTIATDWEKPLVNLLSSLWVQGVRHDAALALAGLLAKKGVPKDKALSVLDAIAEAAGDREWRDRRRACEDTYERVAEGKEVVGFTQLAQLFGESVAKAVDALVPDLRPNSKPQPECRPVPILKPFGSITPPSPKEWLVDNLIACGDLVLLTGRPKVGKSWVALNLGAAVAETGEFLGLKTKLGRALYLDYERWRLTHRRVHEMGLGECADLLGWDVVNDGKPPTYDQLSFLREVIKANSVQLVIVDTAAQFLRPALEKLRVDGALNSYEVTIRLLSPLKEFAEEVGCAIVLVHHERKEGATSDEVTVLGSTGLTAIADVILRLTAEQEDGVFKLSATGNAIEPQVLYFALHDGWATPTEAPAVTEQERAKRLVLVELLRAEQNGQDKLRMSEIREVLEVRMGKEGEAARKLAQRVLSELKDEGSIYSPTRGVYCLTPKARETARRFLGDEGDGDDGGGNGEWDGRDKGQYIDLVPNVPNERDKRDIVPNVPNVPNVPSAKGQKGQKGQTDVPNENPSFIGVSSAKGQKGQGVYVVPLSLTSSSDRCPRCGDLMVLVGDQEVCLTCLQENPEPPDNQPPTSLDDKSSENSDNSVAAPKDARSRSKRLVDTERWLASLTSDGLVSPSASGAHSGSHSGASPPEAADMFPF